MATKSGKKNLKTISLPISDIKLDPSNVRKHDKKNIEALVASLKRFGQQKPIVLDKNYIVRAGNGTLTAAKELGWENIDAVVSDLEPSELTAYAIADNRTAELAEWDMEGLTAQLKSLDSELASIAYDDFDFPEDPVEPSEKDDEIPDTKENEFDVKLGDIWILGNHRVMCGDSTDKEQVDKLMDGQKADIMFTSPPYSDLRDYRGEVDLSIKKLSKIFDIPAKTMFVNLGLKIKNREIDRYWDEWLSEAASRNLPLLSWLIWDKGNASAPAHQQAMFGLSHEWIFVFGEYKKQNFIKENKGVESWGKHTKREKNGELKEATKGEKRKKRQLDTVIYHAKAVTGFTGIDHPAQFPVGLPELFINSSTNSDKDIITDPFLGSGSTLIACEKTNRKCYGMELDPHYVSVIIKRWQDFTGKEAKRARG